MRKSKPTAAVTRNAVPESRDEAGLGKPGRSVERYGKLRSKRSGFQTSALSKQWMQLHFNSALRFTHRLVSLLDFRNQFSDRCRPIALWKAFQKFVCCGQGALIIV